MAINTIPKDIYPLILHHLAPINLDSTRYFLEVFTWDLRVLEHVSKDWQVIIWRYLREGYKPFKYNSSCRDFRLRMSWGFFEIMDNKTIRFRTPGGDIIVTTKHDNKGDLPSFFISDIDF